MWRATSGVSPIPRTASSSSNSPPRSLRAWPAGLTAAGAAERVQRDLEGVRARLNALVANKFLDHDSTADRYVLPDWVRDGLAVREEYRKRELPPSEPPGTERGE